MKLNKKFMIGVLSVLSSATSTGFCKSDIAKNAIDLNQHDVENALLLDNLIEKLNKSESSIDYKIKRLNLYRLVEESSEPIYYQNEIIELNYAKEVIRGLKSHKMPGTNGGVKE